jgi:hypothetical protein
VQGFRELAPTGFDPLNGTNIAAPEKRDYARETSETLAAQVALAPQQFVNEKALAPQYADLQRGILSTSLTGNGNAPGVLGMLENQINPSMLRMTSTANLAQRTDDIDAVTKLGPAALAAWKAANPEQSSLVSELNTQAMSDLRLGATLDPSIRREVAQSARNSQAARGMGYGQNDAAQEQLFTGMRAEQLRGNRRNFGLQVAGLNAQVNADPYSMILGRSGAPGMAMGALGSGQQQSQLTGNRMFNPESSYAQDINDEDYNARAAAKISSGNNKAAIIGASIKAVGSLAGGAAAGGA